MYKSIKKNMKHILLLTFVFFASLNGEPATHEMLQMPTVFINESVDVITGIDYGKKIVAEYYQAGSNDVGGVAVDLEPQDSRIGKVKLQHQSRFFYHPGRTEVLDKDNHRALYHYSNGNCVTSVVHYEGGTTPVCTERLYWDLTSTPQLISRTMENESGVVTLANSFEYDDSGYLIKETHFSNLSGSAASPIQIDGSGRPIDNGLIAKYTIIYEYSTDENHLLLKRIEQNALATEYTYDPQSKKCTRELVKHNGTICKRTFNIYGGQGILCQIIKDNGTSENINDLKGATFRDSLSVVSIETESGVRLPILIQAQSLDIATGKEKTTSYSYNIQGNPEMVTKPDGVNLQYHFDDKGRLAALTSSDNSVSFLYHYDAFGNLTTIVDTIHNTTVYNFDTESMEPIQENPSDDSSSWFTTICNGLYSIVAYVTDTLCTASTQAGNRLADEVGLSEETKKSIDSYARAFLGDGLILMLGYDMDKSTIDVIGQGELSDKVRVTMINGILNRYDYNMENARTLSQLHGYVNVHYVFYATGGWTWDMASCVLSKAGFATSHARDLAKKWKELIQEMGGPHGGGKILHYAHSLGGADTSCARSLLSPDEQKMIHVITLGSPSMVDNHGFGSVENYVSWRDGVCVFGVYGYVKSMLTGNGNVSLVGSPFGIPFVDHSFIGFSYYQILHRYGKDFQHEYGSFNRSDDN